VIDDKLLYFDPLREEDAVEEKKKTDNRLSGRF